MEAPFDPHYYDWVFDAALGKEARALPEAGAKPVPKKTKKGEKILVPLTKCCKKKCFQHIEEVSIEYCRQEIKVPSLTIQSRRKLMLSLRESVLRVPLPSGNKAPCCMEMACYIFKCSRNKLYGRERHKNMPKGVVRDDPKLRSILSWWIVMLSFMEIMPDKDDEYQISAKHRKTVYKWYLGDCEFGVKDGDPSMYVKCHKSYFIKVWLQYHKNIKLRKYLRFAKCDTCISYRKQRDDRTLTTEIRKSADKYLKAHYQDIANERAFCEEQRNIATFNTKDYLCILQDATDQMAFGYPQFAELGKDDDKLNRLKSHIMIDVVMGHGTYAYHVLDHIRRDPNFTIECLQRTLKNVEKDMERLPDTLYLQLDNSQRENKNTAVFGYLSWLVHRGVFKKILVAFLPVGHTHNLADQVASRLSVALRNVEVHTRDQLCEII